MISANGCIGGGADDGAWVEEMLGRPLARIEGDYRVTEPGVTIEGFDIAGWLLIDAPDVTVRFCRISGDISSSLEARRALVDRCHFRTWNIPRREPFVGVNEWPALDGVRIERFEGMSAAWKAAS